MTKIKITIPEKTDNTIYIEHAKKMINNTVDIILQEACKQITQSVPTQYDTQSIRATEDIMNAVSIMTLSDETIKQLLLGVAQAFNTINNDKNSEVNEVIDDLVTPATPTTDKKGGLDDWI